MNVLLTGGSCGIGRAVREYLTNRGVTVYSIDIKDGGEDSFVADVSDTESLVSVREELERRGVELDAIINIAGIFLIDSFIEVGEKELKRIFDVNFMGNVNVNRVFFGLLKKKGRIVITTSEVATLDPMPFNGIYNVSKTALDSYSQALRQELNLLGYKVITVRPGAFDTQLSRGSLKGTEELMRKTELYREQSGKFYDLVKRFMGKPASVERICRVYHRAISARSPRLVYKKHINPLLKLLNILPKRLQCFIIKSIIK